MGLQRGHNASLVTAGGQLWVHCGHNECGCEGYKPQTHKLNDWLELDMRDYNDEFCTYLNKASKC